jgi:hypothetical protein
VRNFLEKRRKQSKSTAPVGRPPKAVVCVDTGQEWPSVTAAAVGAGVLKGAMSFACRAKYKIKGKVYRYKTDVEDHGGST